MSKKPETLFSNQLIKNLNQVFFTRIENKHGGGIPDLYCTYNNKSAFLELKIKTKQNKVIISPLQISWNYKHFLHNPINFYLVNDPRRKVIELYNGDQGPFNVIIIEGAIDYLPEQFLNQLENHGRLFALIKKEDVTNAIMYIKNENSINSRFLFSCDAPKLNFFKKKNSFSF